MVKRKLRIRTAATRAKQEQQHALYKAKRRDQLANTMRAVAGREYDPFPTEISPAKQNCLTINNGPAITILKDRDEPNT